MFVRSCDIALERVLGASGFIERVFARQGAVARLEVGVRFDAWLFFFLFYFRFSGVALCCLLWTADVWWRRFFPVRRP